MGSDLGSLLRACCLIFVGYLHSTAKRVGIKPRRDLQHSACPEYVWDGIVQRFRDKKMVCNSLCVIQVRVMVSRS